MLQCFGLFLGYPDVAQSAETSVDPIKQLIGILKLVLQVVTAMLNAMAAFSGKRQMVILLQDAADPLQAEAFGADVVCLVHWQGFVVLSCGNEYCPVQLLPLTAKAELGNA